MIPISSERIRGWNGKILGSIETDKEGNQQVRDFYGKILAYYDKRCNCTRDFYGKILTQGNTVLGLLYKDEIK